MLDLHILQAIQTHIKPSGLLICLGDQKPSFGSGHANIDDLARGMGFTSVITVDYDGKADVTVDLNEPEILLGYYHSAQCVYDGGTLEHVANIGAAWMTAAALVKTGGIIVHANPLNCYGDSYYGIDPMLPRDLYELNGFETKFCGVYYRTGWRSTLHKAALNYLPKSLIAKIKTYCSARQTVKEALLRDNPADVKFAPELVGQWRNVPTDAHLLYIGMRTRLFSTWRWPSQSMYPKI